MKKLFLGLCALLFASSLEAATVYVDNTITPTSCTNYTPATRLCSGGTATAWKSPHDGGQNINAGDTLEIRGGTYTNGEFGTGWGIMIRLKMYGATSESQRVTIQNYAGEQVILRPAASVELVVIRTGDGSGNPNNFITLNGENGGTACPSNCGIVIDMVNGPLGTGTGCNCGITGMSLESNNFIIQGVEVKNAAYYGIGGVRTGGGGYFFSSADITIRRSYIHTVRNVGPDTALGVYGTGHRWTVENNLFHNILQGPAIMACPSSDGLNPDQNCEDWTIQRNTVHTSAMGFSHYRPGSGTKITRNLIYNINGTAVNYYGDGIDIKAVAPHGPRIYNNTIYNVTGFTASFGPTGYCIRLSGNDAFVRNNITNTCGQGTIQNDGTGNTLSNNPSADPSFVNAAGADFNLAAGSTAINAGVSTIAAGLTVPFNGSAPDAGVYETFVHGSACVGTPAPCSGPDASTLLINFDSSVAAPLLPASSCTGFTARVNTVARTVNSCTRQGDSQIRLVLASAVIAGDTVDYSYVVTGNVTDSALIGNEKYQRLNAITNQSVVNNVGAGSGAIFTQTHGRIRELRGSEAAAAWKAAVDENYTIIPGGAARVRLKVACTAGDCSSAGFVLRAAKNAGAYSLVSDTCTTTNVCMWGTGTSISVTHATATTEQLTSDHVTNVAGAVLLQQVAIVVDLSQNSEFEIEFAVKVGSANVMDDTFDFRLYRDDGTALDTYTVTPRLTVAPARFRTR